MVNVEGSLSADLIAQQSFGAARRGFDPDEVRAFLVKVAAEIVALHERQSALENARRDAEYRAAHPSFDEETLIGAVGDETAHILKSAHDAAGDIKSRAEENASRILKEAHQQAEALRGQAETVLARRTEEAEAVAGRIKETAKTESERLVDQARQQSKAIRAQSEAERNAMIEGAQATREKILTALSKKRNVAVAQVEQLRAGRERLLQSYDVVRRTLEEATAELARAEVEARAAADAVRHRPLALDEPDGLEDDHEPTNPTLPIIQKRLRPAGAASPSPALASANPTLSHVAKASAPPAQPSPAKPASPAASVARPGASSPGVPAPSASTAASTRPSSPPAHSAPSPSSAAAVSPPPPPTASPATAQSASAQSATAPAPTTPPPTTAAPPSAPPAPPPAPAVQATPAPSTVTPSSAPQNGPIPSGSGTNGSVTPAAAAVPDTEPPPDPVAPGPSSTVESLFARIRADRDKAVAHAREVLADDPPIPDADEALLQRRDEVVGLIETNLTRRLKRALQDDQNDLLDRLRNLRSSQKAAAVVLPSREAHLARFQEAGRPFLSEAVTAGVAFTTWLIPGLKTSEHLGGVDQATEDLAEAIVEPLRRRLEGVLVAGEGDDPVVLAEAVGAAYREWKTKRVELVAVDHVATAFAAGSYAATPSGTSLRWLVQDTDGPCPDCDDNVLAGEQPKGEPFPTGQRHPPAHPGCRCLLIPQRG